jgi:hypothetical protein
MIYKVLFPCLLVKRLHADNAFINAFHFYVTSTSSMINTPVEFSHAIFLGERSCVSSSTPDRTETKHQVEMCGKNPNILSIVNPSNSTFIAH